MKPPLAAFTLLALPRMEQVESSWTGERRSPAPGENMAAPLPTGERGLQALQSGPGLIVHGVPTLADELSHHVPLLPHHVSLLFRFLPLRSLCGKQVSGLLQLQLSSFLILKRRHVKQRLPRIDLLCSRLTLSSSPSAACHLLRQRP